MKRLMLRVSFLAVVIGLGTIAVIEAKRVLHRGDEEPRELAPAVRRPEEPKPIPLAVQDGSDSVGWTNPYDNPPQARRDQIHPATDDADVREPAIDDSPSAARPASFDGPAATQQADYAPADANPYAEPRRLRPEYDPALPADANPLAAPRAVAADVQPDVRQVAGASGQQDSLPADEAAAVTYSAGEFRSLPAQREAAAIGEAADAEWQDNFAPPSGAAARPAQSRAAGGVLSESTVDRAGGRTEQGSGRPGEKQLEGAQAPSLTIEKRAPAEIQVGKPAMFSIAVRNVGQVMAQGVEVHDVIPQGTQLVNTTPPAKRSPQGELVWELGQIKPGAESIVQVQLLPLTEGEIGSVATIHFHAGASVRTTATRPQLNLEVVTSQRVMIGGSVQFKIKLSNPGTGAATGVVLSETVPAELKHAAGSELEFEVGTLRPGEQRELELVMTAVKAGPITNVLSARGDAQVSAEAQTQLEVIAPELKIGLTGPKRRYLERSATYNISVSNPGTAPAKDIELVATLPKGLKFVEANNAGQYDAATGAVYWSLEELPPHETGTVTLTALPTEPGELALHIKGQAQQGLSDERDETIVVEGLAAILFELVDVNDPIEVGGDTTYEIRVINQGSKAATNVRVVALLPPQMQAVSADGPARHVVDGQRVLFEPVSQLAPKADTTYTVKVKALEPGDLRLRVQIVTDEIQTPITKEESTRVYADE